MIHELMKIKDILAERDTVEKNRISEEFLRTPNV
jgi:hypothetical protein